MVTDENGNKQDLRKKRRRKVSFRDSFRDSLKANRRSSYMDIVNNTMFVRTDEDVVYDYLGEDKKEITFKRCGQFISVTMDDKKYSFNIFDLHRNAVKIQEIDKKKKGFWSRFFN